MVPHYAEAAFMKTILFLFSHMNFTHEKMSNALNLPWKKGATFEMFTRKIIHLQKKNMEKLSTFLFTQIVKDLHHLTHLKNVPTIYFT